MKLQKLHIKNYKSLVDLEIVEPNPFTVFAGPNGAGKSNIFEALEFILWPDRYNRDRVFGWEDILKNRLLSSNFYEFHIESDEFNYYASDAYKKAFSSAVGEGSPPLLEKGVNEQFKIFFHSFSRYFFGKEAEQKINYFDSSKLNFSGTNLAKVLKRLLEDEIIQEDITEYLEMFIPGFEKIEIISDDLSGTDTLHIYETGISKPFTRKLISDGTYNILCLLTALFQSEEPQFLCIEEPENGLNPYVIQQFVEICRYMCEDYGHYIWLNTHSQTLVRALEEEELILVDKENGSTQIKQFKKGSFYGLKADEAWLTNSLGAGIPW